MSSPLVPRDSRSLLYLIFGVTITGILSTGLLAPAIPNILDEFGKDDSAAGLLVAIGSVPGIFVAPIIGILADRYGRRNVLVPCLVSFGIFGLLAATAPTFELLLLARLGMGFGSAGMINLSVVLIGDHFPVKDQTKLIGRNSAVLTTGLATIPLISGVLTDLVGWRWALALYSFSLATGLAAYLILEGGRTVSVGTIREQLSGAKQAIRDPRVLTTLALGVLVFAVIFGVFLTVLPNHLANEFDLEASGRGVILALPALTSTLAAFNLGKIQDRFGMRATLLVSASGWVVAFAIIAAAPFLGVLAAGSLLYGAGEGSLIPSLQSTAMKSAPEEHRGAVVAVWVGSVRLGQTIGPIAAGAILLTASTTVALWSGFGLALFLLLVLAVSPLVRPPKMPEASSSTELQL